MELSATHQQKKKSHLVRITQRQTGNYFISELDSSCAELQKVDLVICVVIQVRQMIGESADL